MTNQDDFDYYTEWYDKEYEERARKEDEYWNKQSLWARIRGLSKIPVWQAPFYWVATVLEQHCSRYVGNTHFGKHNPSKFERVIFQIASFIEFRMRPLLSIFKEMRCKKARKEIAELLAK